MNNYIPFNKAIGPKVLCDGYEALIPQKLGVDEMTFTFDGGSCEHASCAGAPEMFIKVEEEALYHFGVEADDIGQLFIGEFCVCDKQAPEKHGRLELATGKQYLKPGFYKVRISYANNAYKPVSGNAVALNVTMDKEPIKEGDYSAASTMKRSFSPSPKIKLWTIEKEEGITCEPSQNVEIKWEKNSVTQDEGIDDCLCIPLLVDVRTTACKDTQNNVWRLRVQMVSSGCDIEIHTGTYRNALTKPPIAEAEAIEAVNCMNEYQSRGRTFRWHTPEASLAHEEHHKQQWRDTCNFYWTNLKVQEELEKIQVSCEQFPEMDDALKEMKMKIAATMEKFHKEADKYFLSLPDEKNTRPYHAGQKKLNEPTEFVINLADRNGWNNVPRQITQPGVIEPVCYLPPVNGGSAKAARTRTVTPLQLFIADTADLLRGRIRVGLKNISGDVVKLPDVIDDRTSDFFFYTSLQAGRTYRLNSRVGKITFSRELPCLELSPGEEYRLDIPVDISQISEKLMEVQSGELEMLFCNWHGTGCFHGVLETTASVLL